MMKIIGIIPARYSSQRLPGKPLKKIAGKTMIERVYRQAKKSPVLERVLVATDDQKIVREVKRFGGEVCLTSPRHRSGTDRVAEVASSLKLPKEGIIINIQGDAPLLSPRMLEKLVKPFANHAEIKMTALCQRIKSKQELANPNIVKVVLDQKDFALYFSRLPIPLSRDKKSVKYYKHIGPYAYRKSFLLKLAKIPPTPLEKSEKLEQLRVLESGYSLKMVKTRAECPEIDTLADLRKVEAYLKRTR